MLVEDLVLEMRCMVARTVAQNRAERDRAMLMPQRAARTGAVKYAGPAYSRSSQLRVEGKVALTFLEQVSTWT